MATIEEILKKKQEGVSISPKGTREWAVENGGEATAEPKAENEIQPVTQNVDFYTAMTQKPKVKSDDEIAAEERKAKRDKLFSAIGDGIAAISNLYFTTQGAPSMYEGNTLSKASQVRYDRLKKEREDAKKEYDSWFEGYMRAQRRDEELTDKLRALKRQREQDEYRKEQDAYNRSRQEAADEYRKERDLVADGRYAEQQRLQNDRWDKEYKLSQQRANAAGGGVPKYYGKLGGTEYATRADYEAAVMSKARELGISTTNDIVLERNYDGVPIETKTVSRDIAEIVAEINAKQNSAPKQQNSNSGRVPGVRGVYQGPKKKDNPMGSNEKKKKPNPMI